MNLNERRPGQQPRSRLLLCNRSLHSVPVGGASKKIMAVASRILQGVLYGVVFPIGSVWFGAVNRTEPHRRIFALFNTEPHRTVGSTILENRAEPHRRA